MENIVFTIIGAIVAFFGYNYYLGVQNENTQKKVEKRKSEIANLDTAGLVAFANSILESRRGNRGK